MACTILKNISGLEQSSETTALRYLKLVTVLSFCPSTLISFLVLLAQFVVRLVFAVQFSILYLLQVLSRLSTKVFCSCSSQLDHLCQQQTADCLYFCRLCKLLSRVFSDMIRSRKMLKWMGLRRHPCLTPNCCSAPFSHAAIHLK